MPISLDGIRTCTSGIRAHRASDYTTRVRPPRVSRNKHLRHSPVSSTVKQSCMKHSNSYLRDRDIKHLQGPPLSRTKCVRERRKIELTKEGKKCPFSSTGFVCVCVCVCVCACVRACPHMSVCVLAFLNTCFVEHPADVLFWLVVVVLSLAVSSHCLRFNCCACSFSNVCL